MRGCDEGQARRGATLPAGGDIESFRVDRLRHDGSAGAEQRPISAGIAWILDSGRVTRVEQHAGGQVESLLRASRHDDLLRRAVHAPPGAQVGGNCLA
jgi:hypothetical protein